MNTKPPHPLLSAMDLLRPRKTFADYAAIAVCPVLVMILVGALVFFLVEVGYAGSHVGKLRWTLFWFVMAMVLISRIAIEKGYDHAGIYALALASATGVFVTQYVNNFLPAWCILGLIWWAANKLTWDCTLIDEDVDASGEGLLQAANIDSPRETPSVVQDAETGSGRPESAAKTKTGKSAWWKRPRPRTSKESDKPHAPGLWVLYFSLAALPVFGFGQGLIPSADSAARERAFYFVLSYVAAALGLLLITSFLGLRRYLRQRHIVMPPSISRSWVSLGSTLGLAILIGCILLPRPNAVWSFGAMMDRLGDKAAKSSAKSPMTASVSDPGSKSPGGQGDGSGPGSQPSEDAQPGRASGGEQGGQKAGSHGTPQDANSGPTAPNQAARTASSRPGPGAQPGPAFSPPPLNVFRWLKIAFYTAIAVLGLLLLLKNASHIAFILRAWLAALRDFWRNLFRRERNALSLKVLPSRVPIQPFEAFPNPFSSGAASRMSSQELVVYTFNALASWAQSYRCARLPEETPIEFADHVAEELPEISTEAQQLARLYAQVAYARTSELPPCQTLLEILWIKMTRDGAAVPG